MVRERTRMRRHPLLALVVAAGCGRIGFDPGGGTDDGGSTVDGDGSLVDAAACTSFGPWGAPRRLTELATANREFGAQITPDHLTLYFTRTLGADAQFVATRPDRASPFGADDQLSELGDGCCATVMENELEMYFESARSGTLCIYRAKRTTTSQAWGLPAAGPCVTATAGPYVTPDGLSLYYNTATPPTDYLGTLQVATRSSTTVAFSAGTTIAELAVGATKGYPMLSTDGLTLRFESTSPTDLFETSRPTIGAPFGTAAPIPGINTTSTEQDVSITSDGLELFFSSNRPGSMDLDLYVATRTCL